MFMEHADTIVVHYYRNDSGSEIRQTVDKLFPDQVDRGLRVKSGFDISHPNLDGKEESRSHSELIAWAVADAIILSKDKIISNYDENSFREKFLEVIKMYGNMDKINLYKLYLGALQIISDQKKN
jgi:hypothetical protein